MNVLGYDKIYEEDKSNDKNKIY